MRAPRKRTSKRTPKVAGRATRAPAPVPVDVDDSSAPTSPVSELELMREERRRRALTMRNGGATLRQIAEKLGCSPATVKYDVERAMRDIIGEPIEDMVASQRAMLRDLVRSNYIAALNGDTDAAKIVLKVLEHESKLFGLNAPARVEIGVSDAEFARQAAELIGVLDITPPEGLLPQAALSDRPHAPMAVLEDVPPEIDAALNDKHKTRGDWHQRDEVPIVIDDWVTGT